MYSKLNQQLGLLRAIAAVAETCSVCPVDCPVSHILEGLADFTEESLQGASAYVRPTSLLFDQAGNDNVWKYIHQAARS